MVWGCWELRRKLLVTKETSMKTDRFCIVFLACVFCVSSMLAQIARNDVDPTSSGETVAGQSLGFYQIPSPPNVNQLALLRWYSANVTTMFSLGSGPLGMASTGRACGSSMRAI